MPAKNKVLKQISTVLLVRDQPAGGNTTINGAGAAAGQKVIPVASTNTFAVGDTIRVGSGDELELAVVTAIAAGVSLTVADNLTYTHVVGEAVVEQAAYDLGDITDGGVTVGGSGQTTDVQTANRRLVFTVLNGYVDLTAEFGLPGLTIQNLAFAVGAPLASVLGDGSAATPYAYASDGSDFGGEQNQSLICIGVLQDGSVVRAELWGVDFDYTGISVQLKRGQLASVPVKAVAAAGGLITTNASAYVANTTYRAGKGKVFDALVEVGAFADATAGPLATTLTAAVAAGVAVLPLTSVTNLVVGDWVRITTGETVEFHQVQAINALNVTLKDKTYRAFANGAAVVRQQLVPFGGVSEDGVTLQIGGSVEAMHVATKRMSIGLRLGPAVVTLSLAITDLSLANWAKAFGIPAAAIANNRLPVNSNIGTTQTDGIYAKGLLQDGTTIWIQVWGCSQDVSQASIALAQTGMPALPVKYKPASALFLQAA